jgi:predicted nucleic acid-binding protein
MMNLTSSSVCVDASLVVNWLIAGPYSNEAARLLHIWQLNEVELVAPSLIVFEVTSTLRRSVYLKQIPFPQGDAAFETFLKLPVRTSPLREVVQLSWQLSKRLNLPRAYDSAYLAVAQLNRCEFWTADRRLYNAAHPTFPWVRWIEEALTTG